MAQQPVPAPLRVWVQNASLEIAWSMVVFEGRTIAGEVIVPFLTEGLAGFDINQAEDWRTAEELVKSGEAVLRAVDAGAVRS